MKSPIIFVQFGSSMPFVCRHLQVAERARATTTENDVCTLLTYEIVRQCRADDRARQAHQSFD
jgi:hypothetical protein